MILGVVNSVGLWIIGIENPFLFGFLAALLALIPYAGTFLGAATPVL
jgi:predicted PurR-regulated permease PerM